jgi:rRNA-processing protein FCF1
MRAEIPPDVAALLEQLDRRIEESQALRVELQKKTAERRGVTQTVHEADDTDKSSKA